MSAETVKPEIVKTEDEWKAELDPERYHVLREKGTEPAWTGALLDVHDPGLFRCAACGAELFRSDDKFDSGSGWPSFTRAAADGVIDEHDGQLLRHAPDRGDLRQAAAATWATSSPTAPPPPESGTASTPCRWSSSRPLGEVTRCTFGRMGSYLTRPTISGPLFGRSGRARPAPVG